MGLPRQRQGTFAPRRAHAVGAPTRPPPPTAAGRPAPRGSRQLPGGGGRRLGAVRRSRWRQAPLPTGAAGLRSSSQPGTQRDAALPLPARHLCSHPSGMMSRGAQPHFCIYLESFIFLMDLPLLLIHSCLFLYFILLLFIYLFVFLLSFLCNTFVCRFPGAAGTNDHKPGT